MDLYENTHLKKRHFSFGKNWQKFLKKLTPQRIEEAEKSLKEWLGDISGKTFIDIGCGSGLFSLAANRLGAKVTSVDIDDQSIECTKELKKRFGGGDWKIIKGSALDSNFIKSLGQYDIVYSWGVLHHTGDMWLAIENITQLVKPKGVLYIAIYNKSTRKLEGTSELWKKIKKFYNKTNFILKKIIYILYTTYLIAGITLHGRNPIKYIREYKSNRGMDFFTDIKDWLGGYPYEYATPKEVENFLGLEGFDLVREKTVRSIGCNEYLFKRVAMSRRCGGYVHNEQR
ncbi:class I SAM-dependent methyltransferase [Candidatus Woesearchaeota archaeon]|nr:MAG: class I SAM-dependent methyltransferase [Candidatus Woesearchaeota archaeon]